MSNASIENVSPISKKITLIIWTIGVLSFILLSPKWVVPLAVWIAPACLLFFVRFWKGRIKWLWIFVGLLTAQLIAAYEVIPAPTLIFIIMSIVVSIIGLIPYWLHDSVNKKSNRFIATLVFPSICVVLEFWDSFGGGGIWSSRANSQYSFIYLAQLASVTGLWGISFLIAWFNSIIVWCIERKLSGESFTKPLMVYSSAFLIVTTFGFYRIHFSDRESTRKIKLGGVTIPLFKTMELIYEEFSDNKITIDPKSSQTSESLQQFSKAFLAILENPDTLKFPKSMKALKNTSDSLFLFSKRAANQGAQIVSWSEASCLIFPDQEKSLIEEGRKVAEEKQIYLLMTYAVLHPGKVTPDKKFMENKAVFIGPDGDVLNEFYKNKPVPMAESSVQGDGKIPVIETAYGKISISICYDADFPELMKQLSKNESDLLLLPSGDWFAIAPYHSYMSVFRGIENGTSIFRQVNGGLSFVSNSHGEIRASKNFFTDDRKFWVTETQIGHVKTLYAKLGDWVAYLSILIASMSVLYLITAFVKNKIESRKQKYVTTA
ncbi:MAG: nitrilase-related carbon-nitrogen hydrolase [Chryseolinea sp.]